MSEHSKMKELPEKDRLITRPDKQPLPTAEDPKKPRGVPADPKPPSKKGQADDPQADAVEYTA
jgi:hypothetical protein